MPYKSEAQRRFFHSEGAKKAGISKAEVKKWDKESKGVDISKQSTRHASRATKK